MRLKKGQAPQSAILRHERNRKSVTNLCSLLEDCMENPSIAPSQLRMACLSQGSLAKLSLPSHNILPMSLTTLKRSADLSLPGGWIMLDELRRHILDQPLSKNSTTRTKRGTIARKKETYAQSREEFSAIARDYAVLCRAYFELLNLVKPALRGDEVLSKKIMQHQAIFDIGPRMQPVKSKRP